MNLARPLLIVAATAALLCGVGCARNAPDATGPLVPAPPLPPRPPFAPPSLGPPVLSPRESDCVVAPHEDTLLDDYASDPTIAFVPNGASRNGSVLRQPGCIRLDKEDTSSTSVETVFTLSRDYDRDALKGAYDLIVARRGWAVDTVRELAAAKNPNDGIWLLYCRMANGITSQLTISTHPSQRIDVRPSGPERPPSPQWYVEPGGITVFIDAAPQRANCQAPVSQ